MKLLLVDLDDTLINTSSYKQVMLEKVSQLVKGEVSQITDLYQQSKQAGYFNPQIFRKLIEEKYHINQDLVIKAVMDSMSVISVNQPVFNLLKNFPGKKGILTFGDNLFQRQKISRLDLDRLVDYIYVVQGSKVDFIKSLIKGKFIDIGGELFSEITIVDDQTMDLVKLSELYPWIKVINTKEYLNE